MAPKDNTFSEENDDKLESDDDSIGPVILDPITTSLININDLSIEKKSLKNNTCLTRFSGTIYTLMVSFIFTSASFAIKQLGVDVLDALPSRFIVQTIMTFLFVLYKHYSLLPGTISQIFLQILYSVASAAGLFLFYIAMRYAELSDIITLCYTKVVWTVIFSIFIYRERPSISSILALLLTLVGVTFVTQPSFLFSSSSSPSTINVNNNLRILGLTLSILCAIATTISILSFKKLISISKDIKPSVLNLQCCLAVLIFLIINQLYKKFVLHNGLEFNYIISWRYLLASMICLSMILASILTQKAIKREHPAIFTLLGSADIIFALILQNIFLTTRSNLFALLGSALVILSVVIIGLSKILNEKRAKKKITSIDNQNILKDFQDPNEKC